MVSWVLAAWPSPAALWIWRPMWQEPQNSAVSNPGRQVFPMCFTHNTTSGRNSILNPPYFVYHYRRQNMFILKYFTVNTNFFPHSKCKQSNCFSSVLCFNKKINLQPFPYNRTILKNINTVRIEILIFSSISEKLLINSRLYFSWHIFSCIYNHNSNIAMQMYTYIYNIK